jgi:hypothetical protein
MSDYNKSTAKKSLTECGGFCDVILRYMSGVYLKRFRKRQNNGIHT